MNSAISLGSDPDNKFRPNSRAFKDVPDSELPTASDATLELLDGANDPARLPVRLFAEKSIKNNEGNAKICVGSVPINPNLPFKRRGPKACRC